MIKPGLSRLKEVYRTKASDLSRDMLSLQEKFNASRDVIQERLEENASTEAQVRCVPIAGLRQETACCETFL